MIWGAYDTVDNCWLGDNEGPLLSGEKDLVLLAANVIVVQLGQPFNEPGRVEVREYDNSGTQIKDTLERRMKGERALMKLETGAVLAPVRRPTEWGPHNSPEE